MIIFSLVILQKSCPLKFGLYRQLFDGKEAGRLLPELVRMKTEGEKNA
jgi:hypothetical protein